MTIKQAVALTTYRAQLNAQICALAASSGQKQSTVYLRVYSLVKALYGVDVRFYRQHKNESLLRVAERFDLLDKVSRVVQFEQLLLA